jgi:rhodanese-related sulfurtransferase
MIDPMEITPQELREQMASNDPPLLLDVRKPWEFDFAKIAGSSLLPLDTLSVRVSELDLGRQIVTICHVGMRSLMAADYLRQLGYDAKSLAGGIDLWSEQIDPEVPRY